QGPESKVTIDRYAVGHTKQPVVAGNGLPRKLATRAKAPNVATDLDGLVRTELLQHSCANERVDPIDAARFPNPAISPYRETARATKRYGRCQISRDIYVLVPPACASKNVESRGTRGTSPALGPDGVSTPRFDDGQFVVSVDVSSKCRAGEPAVEFPLEAIRAGDVCPDDVVE